MYFIANWKMNPPTIREAKRLLEQIKSQLKRLKLKDKPQVVIFPPAIFLTSLGKPTSQIKFGIQNIGAKERGAYTGEVSILMAADTGVVDYCLVGHSERKLYYGENNTMFNQKIKLCLEKNIAPIFCIGETAKEKEEGKTRQALKEQLREGLAGVGPFRAKKAIICWEPLWTISSQKGSKPEAPDNVLGITILIRKLIAEEFNQEIARKIKIIYGGSVNRNNASRYVENGGIDGLLIGSASLSPSDFISIIKDSLNKKTC